MSAIKPERFSSGIVTWVHTHNMIMLCVYTHVKISVLIEERDGVTSTRTAWQAVLV
jgi:hypothetical protein